MRRTLRERPSGGKPTGHLRLLREQGELSIIAVTALLAPLAFAPVTSGLRHGAQTIGMELGAVALLVTLLSRPWPLDPLKEFLGGPFVFPLICLHLFLLWAIVSTVRTAAPAFAAQGVLPLAAGVLITDVVAVKGRAIGHCLFVVNALLATGLLVAASGIALYGSRGMPLAVGVFQDHQLFGAFSMLIIPFSLSISLAPVAPVRKIMAQATSVVCLAALLAARCRSAWLGEASALLTFGFLLVLAEARTSEPRASFLRQRHVLHGAGVAAAVIGFLAVFVSLSPDRAATLARARTIAGVLQDQDASTQWRLAVWAGTEAMIAQKTLLGWGIGSYPLRHYPFTKTGHPTEVVRRQGPSIEDEAHDSYLQVTAELGVIGLGLWLATCAGLIVFGILTVRRFASDRFRQRLLVGCLSAIVGQMVDALANPGWQFGCITLYLWIIFGLTLSSMSFSGPGRSAPPRKTSGRFPWARRSVFIVVSLAVGYGLVRLILRTGFALPAPHL